MNDSLSIEHYPFSTVAIPFGIPATAGGITLDLGSLPIPVVANSTWPK
jgi:hypothetical protein